MDVPATNPAVAIAMPTYNHAAFVGEAIESALAQTFNSWELVIVDDGSTDGTLEVVRRYSDPRIHLIERDHRGLEGLGETYRAILEVSTGPLIAILEGDDRWPLDKLERQVADFDDPDVVLSYGVGRLIDECGCEYGTVTPSFPRGVGTNTPTGAILPALLAGNPILSPTVVVRRASLESIGGFWQPDGVPYVDHPTWLLLALEGAFAYHDVAVGSWRRHAAQWTTLRVRDEPAIVLEEGYLGVIGERYRAAVKEHALPALPADTLRRRHVDRALINRWRLALLTARPREIATAALELIRSGQPRSIGLALAGLTMWGLGSDLEWVQRRRERVSWPSRRHQHVGTCADYGNASEPDETF